MTFKVNANGVITDGKKIKINDNGIVKDVFYSLQNGNGALTMPYVNLDVVASAKVRGTYTTLNAQYVNANNVGYVPRTTLEANDYYDNGNNTLVINCKNMSMYINLGYELYDANGNKLNYVQFPPGHKIGIEVGVNTTSNSSYNNAMFVQVANASVPITYPSTGYSGLFAYPNAGYGAYNQSTTIDDTFVYAFFESRGDSNSISATIRVISIGIYNDAWQKVKSIPFTFSVSRLNPTPVIDTGENTDGGVG